MARDKGMRVWRTFIGLKIIGDDEDELENDDLCSDEDLILHSLGNLSHDLIEAMLEKNNMGIIRE